MNTLLTSRVRDSLTLVLVVTIAWVAVVPGRAVALAPVPVVEATRHMRVTGSGVVQTRLNVPRPARLSLDYFTDSNSGAPRFSKGKGFAAISISPADGGAEAYTAARLPAPNTIAQDNVSMGPDTCHLEPTCRVPAGDYRLYVVSEGATTVDIELQGLSGRSTVEVATPAVGEVSRATESYFASTYTGGVKMGAHGAGFSPNLTGRSNLMFTAFWFHGPTEKAGPAPADKPLLQAGIAGSCGYKGAPPGGAYAPGCPGGDLRTNVSTFHALSDFEYLHWGSSANVGPGEHGWGYYAVHSGIHDPGFVGFWLETS